MTLNKLQIKIKNFKSISNTEWISLDGKIEVLGKNFIDGGSNGSGKSSILEALYVSVSLCEISEKGEEQQKQLKKYYRENKYPFEIFVKFQMDNENFEIKATPDGIKNGSAEAKKYLYTLVTSFLMQGMTNSLVKQEASECKSVISSYFECDEIIDNITKNSEIVKTKLDEKITLLETNKVDIQKKIDKENLYKNNFINELKRLETEKNEIQKKIGGSMLIKYDEQEHDEVLGKIQNLETNFKKLDNEIGKLYEQKSLLSGGIELRIKQLKEQKYNEIESAESLYIRTVGNKFGAFVKKTIKEYNDGQNKEYERKEKLAIDEKNKRIKELKNKIEELEKLESEKAYISKEQREYILNRTLKYTNIVSKEITIKAVKEEIANLSKDLLASIKSTDSEIQEKLEKELNAIKKSSVKKPQELKVEVFTLKNKPKKKLPDFYIVYDWDVKTNNKSIVENTATMINSDKINAVLQEIDIYQAPNIHDLDKEINELENTDTAKRIEDIDCSILEKQNAKLEASKLLEEFRPKEKELSERKLKFELYADDNKKMLSIETNIAETKVSINNTEKTLKSARENLLETDQQIERWGNFLDEIKNNIKLVKNSFKDHIIDLYNDRLEPLIDFYSNKVFNFSSKLVIKIGSKTKQPTLNGIKFDFTSGGEKSKALFIFSLAHRDYLSKQRGFNNNYIFCDEVFDGMDEKSRQQSIQFLTQGLVMENVLVISHMEDTTLPDFKKIIVIKNENGTNIK